MNCLRPVYPRWRGEHLPRASLRRFAIGLSPLARGTHGFGTVNFAYVRFIPAGAGNTFQLEYLKSQGSVYPRWRGEHDRVILVAVFQYGLSPLARGTHQCGCRSEFSARFIPAGAGNTPKRPAFLGWHPVYPRWRGEHCWPMVCAVRMDGLSPLARGTPTRGTTQPLSVRFIPAGAGNTISARDSRASSPVYPRWRGEHIILPFFLVGLSGLSPLARGTRDWVNC